MPSTPRLFCVSNASIAALVIMFSVPWVHCEVSSVGRPGQRHENVPVWSSARSARVGGGPVGGEGNREEVQPCEELLHAQRVARGDVEGHRVRRRQGRAVGGPYPRGAARDREHLLGGGDQGGVEVVGQGGGVRLDPPARDGGRQNGRCLCSETGAENVTEMVVFGRHVLGPRGGVRRLERGAERRGPGPSPSRPSRTRPCCPTCWPSPGASGGDEPLGRSRTAATTTTAPARSTQGRRRNGLPALVSRTFMASARSRRLHRARTRRLPAYGSDPAREASGAANSSATQLLPVRRHRDVRIRSTRGPPLTLR